MGWLWPMDLSYFEVIAPCSPHSACCSLHPKPPSPQLGMKNCSQVLDQIMRPFSLGHLMAAGSHVCSAYYLSPQKWLHSLLFPRCQVYSNLFSLGWEEHKDNQMVPISPKSDPKQHILGGRGPVVGKAAEFRGRQWSQ